MTEQNKEVEPQEKPEARHYGMTLDPIKFTGTIPGMGEPPKQGEVNGRR